MKSVNAQMDLTKILLLLAIKQKHLKLLRLRAKKKQERKKRIWRQFIYTENEREINGYFNQLTLYMKTENEIEFRKATRMGINNFKLLFNLLKKRITKKDIVRESIAPECRLAITLVYLGQGVSRQLLALAFRVGVSTVGNIINETCAVIWDELHDVYLRMPDEDKWNRIATEFELNTGIPHVLGVLGGKHVRIKCPQHAVPKNNIKNQFSIELLAICNSDHNFIAVDIGSDDIQSNRGILQECRLGKQILDNSVHALRPRKVANSNIILPYYFIGDSGFPLKPNIITPYPARNASTDQERFNQILLRANIKIINIFGVLAAKWRVLNNQLDMLPSKAEKIVKATVLLHNFVKFHENEQYCPDNYVDQFTESGDIEQGLWREEVPPFQKLNSHRHPNSSRLAFATRDKLKEYLLES